jgi:hypothetical protein
MTDAVANSATPLLWLLQCFILLPKTDLISNKGGFPIKLSESKLKTTRGAIVYKTVTYLIIVHKITDQLNISLTIVRIACRCDIFSKTAIANQPIDLW